MTHLKEGDVAPDFTGITETEATVNLTDYRGKKLIFSFIQKITRQDVRQRPVIWETIFLYFKNKDMNY